MASVTQRFSRNEPYFPASRDRLSRNLAAILRMRRMTPAELAERAGIDDAIVRALVRGEITRPSLTTLDALAAALEIDVCDLIAPDMRALERRGDMRGFDRRTNPLVAEVAAAHPQLFADWSPADYDDLYSRFGVGGPLSAEGTLACAQSINDRRALALKVAVLLETEHGAALAQTVDRLYSSAVL
jgi:transcriptional regulator with XRE-family HTH domain